MLQVDVIVIKYFTNTSATLLHPIDYDAQLVRNNSRFTSLLLDGSNTNATSVTRYCSEILMSGLARF